MNLIQDNKKDQESLPPNIDHKNKTKNEAEKNSLSILHEKT
jgi:hypothetical protein